MVFGREGGGGALGEPARPTFWHQLIQSLNFPLFNCKKNSNFLDVTFTFLDHFGVALLILSTFYSILVLLWGFGIPPPREIQDGGSKMAAV